MASKFNYQQIQGIKGNPFVTDEFIEAVEGLAERLGARPEHILAAMSFESGHTFDPGIQNRIKATGLIQFIPKTAIALGTTVDKLKLMSAVEQLKFVEKYFDPFKGKLTSLEAVYTSILSGRPRKPDDVLFTRGTKEYEQNPLDWNQDGVITAQEATTIVAAILFGGVLAAQRRLEELGFVPDLLKGKFADGRWGRNTSLALGEFQKSKGLSLTGLMDEATGFALLGAPDAAPPVASPPVTPPPVSPEGILEKGSKGDAVKALQDSLVKLGYLTTAQVGGGHGTFGPLTEGAVNAFQAHMTLAVTGKFGSVEQELVNEIDRGIGQGNLNIQAVTALQNRLLTLTLMTQEEINTGPGIFGRRTERAVKEWQSKNGLPETGVVDPANFKGLFNSADTGSSGGIDPTEELEPGVFRARAGTNYLVRDDILMTAPLQAKVEKVADAYFRITGKKITITSGYRGPFRQARAMHKKTNGTEG